MASDADETRKRIEGRLRSPTDFTAARSADRQITVTLPSWYGTLTADQVVGVEVQKISGQIFQLLTAEGTHFTISGGNKINWIENDTIEASDLLVVVLDGPDPSSLAKSSYEVVGTETNATDGTFDYYIDMLGWGKNSFQLILDPGAGVGIAGIVITIYGTEQDDGTAAAACTYCDNSLTSDVFGIPNYTCDDTTGAVNDTLNDDEAMFSAYRYLHVKVVVNTGGLNDADFTIRHRKITLGG